MTEQFKRQTAYKIRIGDLIKGKPILEGTENPEQQRFKFLELEGKNIFRVNIVSNIVDKYFSEGSTNEEGITRKKYISFTIDDGSGQIRLKQWGEEAGKFESITQGNTVLVVGTLRFYNNELYISPEIIRIADPKYLLVRKLELDKEKPKIINKEEVLALRDKIIEMIKAGEEREGVETEKLILELNSAPDLINKEITKLLEEGLAYEPRPGKIRYLG